MNFERFFWWLDTVVLLGGWKRGLHMVWYAVWYVVWYEVWYGGLVRNFTSASVKTTPINMYHSHQPPKLIVMHETISQDAVHQDTSLIGFHGLSAFSQ